MTNYGLVDYFKSRSKKAISLTFGERKYINKQKLRINKAIKISPKKVKKYGKKINFWNLYK